MIVDSIHFRGHTCFKTGWSGFGTVKPINVIIGRNNSGKSHLLDLVETLCSGMFNQHGWQYRCVGTIDRASLEHAFPSQLVADEARGLSYWDAYGRHYVDAGVTWETDERGGIRNLEPWFANRTKGLVKRPKLYVRDAGLAAFLCGVHTADALGASPLAGPLWETFVCAEIRRGQMNRRGAWDFHFWGDRTREADFLLHRAGTFSASARVVPLGSPEALVAWT